MIHWRDCFKRLHLRDNALYDTFTFVGFIALCSWFSINNFVDSLERMKFNSSCGSIFLVTHADCPENKSICYLRMVFTKNWNRLSPAHTLSHLNYAWTFKIRYFRLFWFGSEHFQNGTKYYLRTILTILYLSRNGQSLTLSIC